MENEERKTEPNLMYSIVQRVREDGHGHGHPKQEQKMAVEIEQGRIQVQKTGGLKSAKLPSSIANPIQKLEIRHLCEIIQSFHLYY